MLQVARRGRHRKRAAAGQAVANRRAVHAGPEADARARTHVDAAESGFDGVDAPFAALFGALKHESVVNPGAPHDERRTGVGARVGAQGGVRVGAAPLFVAAREQVSQAGARLQHHAGRPHAQPRHPRRASQQVQERVPGPNRVRGHDRAPVGAIDAHVVQDGAAQQPPRPDRPHVQPRGRGHERAQAAHGPLQGQFATRGRAAQQRRAGRARKQDRAARRGRPQQRAAHL